MLHSKFVRGALVYYDNYPFRWVDAIGKDVVKFLAKPGTSQDDQAEYAPTRYTVTPTSDGGGGVSTVVNSLKAGELLLITTDNAEYDGINMQLKGEPFKLTANLPLYFGIKCKISAATQSDFMVGLCEPDTTLFNVDTSHAIAVTAGGIFFSKLDKSTVIAAKVYEAGAETNTGNAATAMTTGYHIYEFYWDGTRLEAYMNAALVALFTADFALADLTPSIAFLTGTTAAITMEVAWTRAIQIR